LASDRPISTACASFEGDYQDKQVMPTFFYIGSEAASLRQSSTLLLNSKSRWKAMFQPFLRIHGAIATGAL